jgi:hypothetical protein
MTLSPKQTATVSLAIHPQELGYLGLNTFTPQPSTADFTSTGISFTPRIANMVGANSAMISTLSYKRYDVDTRAQNNEPYQLLMRIAPLEQDVLFRADHEEGRAELKTKSR